MLRLAVAGFHFSVVRWDALSVLTLEYIMRALRIK